MYNYLFYFLPKYLNKLLFHIQTCYGCITNRARPTLVNMYFLLPLRACLTTAEDSWTALIFCYWPAFKNMFSLIQLLCLLIYAEMKEVAQERELQRHPKWSSVASCLEKFHLCGMCGEFFSSAFYVLHLLLLVCVLVRDLVAFFY